MCNVITYPWHKLEASLQHGVYQELWISVDICVMHKSSISIQEHAFENVPCKLPALLHADSIDACLRRFLSLPVKTLLQGKSNAL